MRNRSAGPLGGPCEQEQDMEKMAYLFAAYAAIWIIIETYLLSVRARERSLREEFERLREFSRR